MWTAISRVGWTASSGRATALWSNCYSELRNVADIICHCRAKEAGRRRVNTTWGREGVPSLTHVVLTRCRPISNSGLLATFQHNSRAASRTRHSQICLFPFSRWVELRWFGPVGVREATVGATWVTAAPRRVGRICAGGRGRGNAVAVVCCQGVVGALGVVLRCIRGQVLRQHALRCLHVRGWISPRYFKRCTCRFRAGSLSYETRNARRGRLKKRGGKKSIERGLLLRTARKSPSLVTISLYFPSVLPKSSIVSSSRASHVVVGVLSRPTYRIRP